MNLQADDFILPRLKQMQAYVPGFQPQNEQKEYIKLNTNENPFPPSPAVIDALKKALDLEKNQRLHLYPNPPARRLRQAIAGEYQLSEDHILVGNGSDEVLSLLFRGVLDVGECLIGCEPSYSLYPVLAQTVGAKYKAIPLKQNWHVDFQAIEDALKNTSEKETNNHTKLVILANPNAPTSLAETDQNILGFANTNPSLTVVDEAYAAFMQKSLGSKAGSKDYPRLIVCGTFSKSHSLAGQRIGWLLAAPSLIHQLDKIRDSYNVNYLGQVAALAAWQDKAEINRRIAIIQSNREFLSKQLSKLGFSTIPASANFIFTQPPPRAGSALEYSRFLADRKIYVRYFPKPQRITNHVRITIGTKEELEMLVKVTKEWVH